MCRVPELDYICTEKLVEEILFVEQLVSDQEAH
jgi:hypothetical protein